MFQKEPSGHAGMEHGAFKGLTGDSGSSAGSMERFRKETRCWLRSEKRRKDSLLREAKPRSEAALLNPLPSPARPSTPCRERRTLPTQPDTCT